MSNINRFHFLVALLILTVVCLSVWQGAYSLDPHHWGLMLSNAKDLYEGKLPYKEIFIQYGILTTMIHTFAYAYLGGNLIALIFITSVSYGVALWFLYLLAIYSTQDKKVAFYILATAVLIHPIVIYPWSNYLAFSFLMMGIYGAIKYPNQQVYRFLTGISLGCAVLSREGLAPAMALFIFTSILIDCYVYRWNGKYILKSIINSLAGLLLPVILFLCYLQVSGLLQYWYVLAWELPKVYATTMFKHMSGLNILSPFVSTLINGVKELNIRWIIFSILFFINVMSVFVCALQLRRHEGAIKYLKISIVALLLISSALHFTEIFRLSTGSIVGLVVVYGVLRALKIATAFFIITAMFLVVGFTRPEAGNYFFPAWTEVKTAQKVEVPKHFRGQYWSQHTAEYYANIETDLKAIQQADCNISYHFNHTMDVFLQVISPFTQYQIAPFYTSDAISSLRVDIGPKAQMEVDKKIIIMQMVQNIHRDVFRPPDEYYVYKKYYAPDVPFIPPAHTLLIMIPLACKLKIDQANIVK